MTTTTKLMTVTLNGFHGYESHKCRVEIRDNPDFVADPADRFDRMQSVKFLGSLAPSAAKKFGCVCAECCCGEGLDSTNEFGLDEVDLEFGTVEIRGNYPQNR